MRFMSNTVSEEEFETVLRAKLGSFWDRAIDLFRNCGPNLSYDVTNVLLLAVEQEKTDQVLSAIERHYEKHLKYQHPDIRGLVSNVLIGVNPTEVMFLDICTGVLGLQPTPA